MADYVAVAARSLLRGDLSVGSLGSLYSGAFDELGAAVKRVFGPVSTHYVAEREESFRAVLREAYNPRYLLQDVCEAPRMPHVDILVASPPCVEVSRAQ